MNEKKTADREIYWQWLCSCPILTTHERTVLLRYFGSAKEIYDAPVSELAPFRKTGRKWVASLISYKTSCDLDKNAALLKNRNIRFCSRGSRSFPGKLLQLPDCPYGLFYRGSLPDPGVLSVAVIGARRCSHYGARMAAYLGTQLARNHVQVISGMASGIDGMAQRACLEENGRSFAVLGCGADICYPPENRELYRALSEKGGVLSEYGPATPPLPGNFPIRNRLISGLADAVIVVEARKKSGSLITVDLALDQGREVYAVPGRFGDELSYGCNHLIEQGAGLLISVDRMLEDLRQGASREAGHQMDSGQRAFRDAEQQMHHQETGTSGHAVSGGACPCGEEGDRKDSFSGTERLILEKLDDESRGIDQLMQETGLPMTELMQGLITLQVRKYAREVSRNRYIKSAPDGYPGEP